ncbi:MAG: hypothetical protein WCL02_06095 [bacterium]
MLSSRLVELTFSMLTHAVTPLENSTSLQLELFAETKEINPQNIPIIPRLSKIFFIITIINE